MKYPRPIDSNPECVQAKEKRQAKEAQVSKAQMDAARRGGVSWGMADDAALEEDLDDVTKGNLEIDWLVGWLVGWLAGWLVGWLVGQWYGHTQSLGTRAA